MNSLGSDFGGGSNTTGFVLALFDVDVTTTTGVSAFVSGVTKFRALRLDTGTFSWASETTSRKARILDVNYNASNMEMVRTKTLVKNAIVTVDATAFRQWYEQHYGIALGKKKKGETETTKGAVSKKVTKKLEKRKATRNLDPALNDQFNSGRLLACISSRPGQSGRFARYIVEGKELEFYQKKMKK
jgi:small subunit ribosomal protein S8e